MDSALDFTRTVSRGTVSMVDRVGKPFSVLTGITLFASFVCLAIAVSQRANPEDVERDIGVTGDDVEKLTVAAFWLFLTYIIFNTVVLSAFLGFNKNAPVVGSAITFILLGLMIALFVSAYAIQVRGDENELPAAKAERREIGNGLVASAFAFMVMYILSSGIAMSYYSGIFPNGSSFGRKLKMKKVK